MAEAGGTVDKDKAKGTSSHSDTTPKDTRDDMPSKGSRHVTSSKNNDVQGCNAHDRVPRVREGTAQGAAIFYTDLIMMSLRSAHCTLHDFGTELRAPPVFVVFYDGAPGCGKDKNTVFAKKMVMAAMAIGDMFIHNHVVVAGVPRQCAPLFIGARVVAKEDFTTADQVHIASKQCGEVVAFAAADRKACFYPTYGVTILFEQTIVSGSIDDR
eukprot:gene22642-48371_t